MFSAPDGPTALVCASDSLALGAWNYVLATTGPYASSSAARTSRAATSAPSRSRKGASRALRPAVIGFDDTPVARAVGLTTVAQPLAEVAQACIRLLTAALDGGGKSPPEHVLLTPRLVVRDSA